ncbi:MAG TPA: hypothetical protein ENN12_00920 [Epsilonproteobacteria bacterium]|nr:hypothetical protein [Campylobacterota bacterium]
MKQTIFSTIIIGFLSLGIYYGLVAYFNAKKHQAYSQELASYHSVENILEYKLQKLANILSLGLIDNETVNQYKKIQEKQTQHEKQATYFAYLSLGFLFVAILLSSFTLKANHSILVLSISGVFVLGIGVLAPIMTMIIQKDIDLIGRIVLSFESRSVVGTIEKLFAQEEWVVGIAILVFSLLLPLGKLLSLFLLSFFFSDPLIHKLVHIFKIIGKWSMVDVFIVAIFLVYITSGKSDTTQAYSGIGLYFFLGYVIISTIATIQSKKMLQQATS